MFGDEPQAVWFARQQGGACRAKWQSVLKMGIKFLCPNGHKLNVKSFLGGKKAICPKCGARVVVPNANQAAAIDARESAPAGSSADLSNEAQVPGPQLVASADGPPPGSPPARPLDPIDEVPSAVWYVRPATGGQFGPASGEIMRAWFSAGRIGASSLVWRAGWPEWRSAAATFPQLAGLLASPEVAFVPAHRVATGHGSSPISNANGMAVQVGGTLPTGQVVQSVALRMPELPTAAEPISAVPPLAKPLRKRRHKTDASIIASSILAVVSIILVIVLVLVWRNQNPSAEKESEVHQEVTLK
ncbi:MAG: DUF4339 domain-containing protein [Planctomycetia bacterium]|nr:DUF4339 domain-containing protein [Planctomycetia bacterium]